MDLSYHSHGGLRLWHIVIKGYQNLSKKLTHNIVASDKLVPRLCHYCLYNNFIV